MVNRHSSDGMAEDLIRAITQLGCAEAHYKTLYEKSVAELENGIIDTSSDEAVQKQLAKIDAAKEGITETAELRRKVMLRLYETYGGDKSYWCEIKHLAIASYTLFEAYEASDDETILSMANEAQKCFTKALSAFLGTEITDCAACFAEFLRSKE